MGGAGGGEERKDRAGGGGAEVEQGRMRRDDLRIRGISWARVSVDRRFAANLECAPRR
jgi:hypothetical protein